MDLLRGRKLGRIVSRRRSFSSETTDLDGFVYPLGFVRWSNVNRNGGGGREEVVTNDSDQGRDGKDDEVDYVFQKDARRGDTRRRHTGGGRGGI